MKNIKFDFTDNKVQNSKRSHVLFRNKYVVKLKARK